jgi:hypothetical protein
MRPAASTLRRWRENPVAFAVECCKFEPDASQRDFLSVFPSQDPDKLRMYLQACTGSGKTATLVIAGLNFVSCYGGQYDHPQGLCTSITGANLGANLWPELANWQRRSEWLKREFRWTATRFSSTLFPETWFLEARPWAKKANIEEQGRTFSGLHGPFVLVLLDESGDIPVPVLRSAEQIFSTQYRWAKLCQGGNPTSKEGHALYQAAVVARHMWYGLRITGDPDNPKRCARINIENARAQIKLYGREDPWVKATILGEFPDSAINSLLGADEVQAAMERDLDRSAYDWAQKRLGVDVSRFGDDPTILFPRQGLQAGIRGVSSIVMRHKRDSPVSVNIANRVMLAKQRWNWELCTLDATGGWAAGARDILVAAGYPVMSLQYHAPAPDPRYKNMRAYMHWHGAQWIKNGGALPNDPELPAELTATTYSYVGGQMLMEPKDRVKEKIGRSPNKADALYQTFALPDMPGEQTDVLRKKLFDGAGRSRSDADFDPHDSTPTTTGGDFDPYRESM